MWIHVWAYHSMLVHTALAVHTRSCQFTLARGPPNTMRASHGLPLSSSFIASSSSSFHRHPSAFACCMSPTEALDASPLCSCSCRCRVLHANSHAASSCAPLPRMRLHETMRMLLALPAAAPPPPPVDHHVSAKPQSAVMRANALHARAAADGSGTQLRHLARQSSPSVKRPDPAWSGGETRQSAALKLAPSASGSMPPAAGGP